MHYGDKGSAGITRAYWHFKKVLINNITQETQKSEINKHVFINDNNPWLCSKLEQG